MTTTYSRLPLVVTTRRFVVGIGQQPADSAVGRGDGDRLGKRSRGPPPALPSCAPCRGAEGGGSKHIRSASPGGRCDGRYSDSVGGREDHGIGPPADADVCSHTSKRAPNWTVLEEVSAGGGACAPSERASREASALRVSESLTSVNTTVFRASWRILHRAGHTARGSKGIRLGNSCQSGRRAP
jgi:hypothetical protein